MKDDLIFSLFLGGAQVPAQFLPPYALPYPLPDADGSWAARTQKYIIRPNGQKENGKDQEVEGENESGGKDDDSDKEKRSSPSAGSEYSDKRGRKEKRTSDEEDDDEEVGPPHKRLKYAYPPSFPFPHLLLVHKITSHQKGPSDEIEAATQIIHIFESHLDELSTHEWRERARPRHSAN